MLTATVSHLTVGRHPAARPGLDALAAFLCVEGYSSHATARIVDHVAAEGTLAGLVDDGYLEPVDEAEAEQTYVDNLRPVPQCGRDWEDESVYMDVDSLLAAWEGQQVVMDAAERVERGITLRDPDGSIVPDCDDRALMAAINDQPY